MIVMRIHDRYSTIIYSDRMNKLPYFTTYSLNNSFQLFHTQKWLQTASTVSGTPSTTSMQLPSPASNFLLVVNTLQLVQQTAP